MESGFLGYGRFLDGDSDSFRDVVSEYGNRLIYFIFNYIKNITAAEDLMEDVFVELIVRKKKFNTEPEFRAYIFKTARNKALNYIKKESKYSSVELDEETPDEKESLDKMVFDEERELILASCLDDLRPEYRDALYLVYFENLSYEQTAKILKKNKKQVDNLVYRAKLAMRNELESRGIHGVADL